MKLSELMEEKKADRIRREWRWKKKERSQLHKRPNDARQVGDNEASDGYELANAPYKY